MFNVLLNFFYCSKIHITKFFILAILKCTVWCTVKWIHIIVNHLQNSSTCKTDTLYPLNNSFPFLPPSALGNYYFFVSLILSALCLVAQLWLTLCDSMHCSPLGSSVHGDSPGKNIGLGCHALLQGISPTHRSNPGLLHCRQILYHLSHQGSGAKF